MTNLVTRHLGQLPGRSKLVRRRQPKDLGPCARLLEVVYYEAHYPVVRPDRPRDWLEGEDLQAAWVAERGGEILGHIAISTVGGDPVSALRWRETTERDPAGMLGISRFFVRPRSRGQGIGTALFDTAVAEIRDRGRDPVIEVVSEIPDGLPFLQGRHWRLIAADPWGNSGKRLQVYRYAPPRG